jgi:hypothetical protein
MMNRLADHAERKRWLPAFDFGVLQRLAAMMAAPDWNFGDEGKRLFGQSLSHRQAERRFIDAVKNVAVILFAFAQDK